MLGGEIPALGPKPPGKHQPPPMQTGKINN